MPLMITRSSLVQQVPAPVPAGNKNNGFSSVSPVKNSPALAVHNARVAFQGTREFHPLRTRTQSPLNRPDWQSSSLVYRNLYGQPATPTKPRPEPAYLSDPIRKDSGKTQQLRSSPPPQKSASAANVGKAPAANAQRGRNPAASGPAAHPGYLLSSEPDLRYQPKPFVSNRIQASLKKAIPANTNAPQKLNTAAPQVPMPMPMPIATATATATSNMPKEPATILFNPLPLHLLARQNLPVAGRVTAGAVEAAAPSPVNDTLAQRSGNIEMKQSNIQHLMERLDKLPPTKIESLKDQLNKLEEKLVNAEDFVGAMQTGPEASAAKRPEPDRGSAEFARSKVKRLIDFFESR